MKKIKNRQPQIKCTGSYKKKSVHHKKNLVFLKVSHPDHFQLKQNKKTRFFSQLRETPRPIQGR